MTNTTKALISQNAALIKGCWNLNESLKRTVIVPMTDSFDIVADEFTDWAAQRNLTYDHIVVINGYIHLGGFRHKK